MPTKRSVKYGSNSALHIRNSLKNLPFWALTKLIALALDLAGIQQALNSVKEYHHINPRMMSAKIYAMSSIAS